MQKVEQKGFLYSKDRANGLTYAVYGIALPAVLLALFILLAVPLALNLLTALPTGPKISPIGGTVIGVALGVTPFLVYVLSAIFLVRRLHDLNLSGWWALLWLVLAKVLFLVAVLLSLIVAFIPGNKDENRYGLPVKPRKWYAVR